MATVNGNNPRGSWRLILATVILLLLSVWGCEYDVQIVERPSRLKAVSGLQSVAFATERAMIKADTPPPGTAREYGDWLMRWAPDVTTEGYVFYDDKQGVFLDPWNRPVVIIAREGTVSGLGSAGPNGVWEEGKNDDVVLMFQDEGIIAPPKESP
jgi:hypothetical protein